jgi:CMP/dCMP kinase
VGEIDLQIRSASVDDGRPCDVLVDGQAVTPLLRMPTIDAIVSRVSAHPGVRSELLPIQRRAAEGGLLIMVGRDIATVVFPDADVKIYLDADLDERARRRLAEYGEKGLLFSLDEAREELRGRDFADSNREAAPLTQAWDATVVETVGKSSDQVVSEIAAIATRTWEARARHD